MNSKDLYSINEAFANAAATTRRVAEGSKDDPLGTGKTQELGGATRDVKNPLKKKKKKTTEEGSKPDFLDVDKDGNKKEPMKKALKDKKKVNEKATDQRPKDEVKADEIEDGGCEQVHDDLQEPIEGSEKEEKKSKKTENPEFLYIPPPLKRKALYRAGRMAIIRKR